MKNYFSTLVIFGPNARKPIFWIHLSRISGHGVIYPMPWSAAVGNGANRFSVCENLGVRSVGYLDKEKIPVVGVAQGEMRRNQISAKTWGWIRYKWYLEHRHLTLETRESQIRACKESADLLGYLPASCDDVQARAARRTVISGRCTKF